MTDERPERPEKLKAGSEPDILWRMVDHYRATLLLKCDGLSDDQLKQRSALPSTLSLLGLLRHMAMVEQYWFQQVFLGREITPLFSLTEQETEQDADFNDLDGAPRDEVVREYLAQCDASREAVGAASLEELAVAPHRGEVSLRYIGVHMVEEYARHCGHADLLREAIDGSTGY